MARKHLRSAIRVRNLFLGSSLTESGEEGISEDMALSGILAEAIQNRLEQEEQF